MSRRGAPVGSIVRLYLDDPVESIEPGHLVVTASTGRSYRVVEARRPLADGRWHLVVQVIDPASALRDDVVHTLTWYSRDRKKPTRRERLAALEAERSYR